MDFERCIIFTGNIFPQICSSYKSHSLKHNEILNVTWYQFFLFFKDYHSDNLVQNSRTSNYGLSQDIKKPLGGLISSDLSSSHPGHAHAFSHYSQMGMTAAKSHMMGGTVPGGGMTPPTGAHPAATHRSSITDFFGKMMSFSSCQTPVLPSYYQNSMYSTEKIDSHLWFGSFVWEKSRQNLISSCSLKIKKKKMSQILSQKLSPNKSC